MSGELDGCRDKLLGPLTFDSYSDKMVTKGNAPYTQRVAQLSLRVES